MTDAIHPEAPPKTWRRSPFRITMVVLGALLLVAAVALIVIDHVDAFDTVRRIEWTYCLVGALNALFWLTVGYRVGQGSKHRWLAIAGTILWLAALSIVAVAVLVFVFFAIPAIESLG
ncbi:hypothetical protein ACGGZK_07315 [Agromyces sp. MMS24-K17]|uniref:hypothetical protein n=1 Tax=Agromyces sp. MMS24-K17 TaxID=3372850 RepID=UPI00375517DC